MRSISVRGRRCSIFFRPRSRAISSSSSRERASKSWAFTVEPQGGQVRETEREEKPAWRRDGREEEVRSGRVKRGEDREVAVQVYPTFNSAASIFGRMRDEGWRMSHH